jgi:WhiB family transcriptional regulator, redox-sensing transcriptional regulator
VGVVSPKGMTNVADTRRLPVAVTDVWDWQMRGACRGMDSALFFHPENERGPARVEREVRAKQICGGCLVLDRCRAHALAVHEPYGVWGGLSESERDEIVRAQDRTLRVLTTPAPRSITSERV